MSKSKNKLKILSVVSEVVPFIATGGMGQVAGALATALAENSPELDVRVVAPLYAQFREKYEPSIRFVGEAVVKLAWRELYCGVYELEQNNVTYYFVDNRHYFGREAAYGYYDDGERFAFFSKAVFTVMQLSGFTPDVIHAHDWQTALVPIYIKTRFAQEFGGIRTVFTIHNMEYQGKYASEILTDVFDLWPTEMGLVEYDSCINLLKGAIVCADKLTTVSPTYARELQSGGGYGLDAIIAENAYKLSGIINGIDTKSYDPRTDQLLEKNYSEDTIEDKVFNKAKLQELFGLPVSPRKMLICVVSRLVSHKGIDLITYMLSELMKLDIQFLLLGTGDHDFELFFEEMALRYTDKIGVSIAYNPEIANKIYAGADVMLMPSRSEPCGLAQMIACRYGTIPIVRKTGGLADTISDCRMGNGNGFIFDDYSSGALLDTVTYALDLYANREGDWKNLMIEAMRRDFGWDLSAKAYADVYKALCENK
ncbi:MAG: glycogen synthase [Oscillospiraceae bacterium]|nr:glycogen synthase [Oscillospiraceae bacterium]MCL2125850.1 glycogen synthase [Oscillospiraceae bacterium]